MKAAQVAQNQSCGIVHQTINLVGDGMSAQLEKWCEQNQYKLVNDLTKTGTLLPRFQ